MPGRIQSTLLGLLTIGAVALLHTTTGGITAGNSRNVVARVDVERIQSTNLTDVTGDQVGDAQKSPDAPCTLVRTNGTLQYFWDSYTQGSRTVTYFDPTICGSPTYPFEIGSISFPLYDPGGYQWPVQIDIVVFDDNVSGDPCDGPGVELCRFTIVCEEAFWSYPNQGIVYFPSACCVNGPFYIGVEYTDDGAGPMPSVLFDDLTAASCENWAYEGGWLEWYDQWDPPVPGYPLFWVYGETELPSCESSIVINELNSKEGHTGAELESHRNQWVELFNASSLSQSLSGWVITNGAGAQVAALPSWTLPPMCYLTVHLGSGTNDSDFSDQDGHYYTGDSSTTFVGDEDECALYSGAPSIMTVVDFIAWGNGSHTPGVPDGDASTAGIWTSGDYFDTGELFTAHTIGRVFNGWDTNVPGDWMVFRWKEYITTGLTQPENPAMLTPENSAVVETNSPTFTWNQATSIDSYQLQVDDDPDFSSPEIDTVISSKSLTSAFPLPNGMYSFRIRGIAGSLRSLWSAVRRFLVFPNITVGAHLSSCPFKFQRKDTEMLCIWDDANAARPGCAETGAHRWDVPHPDAAPPGNEPHCDNYCARASIAMINDHYGGTLSQDRVSYHYFNEITDRVVGPEGDLGHGSWMVGMDFVNSISWALSGAAINSVPRPAGGFTFAQMKGWIDQLDCFVINVPGHVVVTTGYIEVAIGNVNAQVVFIHDPARGAFTPKVYSWNVLGLPQPGGITDNITWVFLQPVGHAGAFIEEASIRQHSDGDEVVDFDEQTPRAFHSNKGLDDTDKDQVIDKNEIRNYTFHDQPGHHPGHENDALDFPDIDGDNLRAENDCDSDSKNGAFPADGDFDGGEDINGDGFNPGRAGGPGNRCDGETCQFWVDDYCIEVATDKMVYALGEPVYIVDLPSGPWTHTYHEWSLYWYEIGLGCPTKADGDPIAHHNAFFTDGGGHAFTDFVEFCWPPGWHYLYVDVLTDNLYSTPDNWDPWTCWYCDEDWFHGWHWFYDWEWHNPEYTWPPYEYPLITTFVPSKQPAVDFENREPVQTGRIVEALKLEEPVPEIDRDLEKTLPDTCETLTYWETVYYYWPLPNMYGDDYYNMRFTPDHPCTLTTFSLWLSEGGSVINSPYGIDVVVWDDDGYGFPGVELARVNVAASHIDWFPIPTVVDLYGYGLYFEGDFHVGYSPVDPVADVYSTVSDEGMMGDLRSSFWNEGWILMHDIGIDVNFLMDAEVCYYSSGFYDVVIYVPWWWWCYEWPPPVRDYWIGVSIPMTLYEFGDVAVTVPPAFSEPFGRADFTPMSFIPDPAVEADLNAQFGDEDNYWVGFKIPSWIIPDSLMSTMVQLSLSGEKSVGDFYSAIRMGDSEYGWSPTFYDSLHIQTGGPSYVCGDADASGAVDIDDVVYLIAYIFSGGSAPVPLDAGDADCSGAIDIDDVVYLINYIFSGGPAPCCP